MRIFQKVNPSFGLSEVLNVVVRFILLKSLGPKLAAKQLVTAPSRVDFIKDIPRK